MAHEHTAIPGPASRWEGIWAYPPLHTECFDSVCESGRVNRQLGLRRLDQGLIAGLLVAVATALAAARLRSRTELG